MNNLSSQILDEWVRWLQTYALNSTFRPSCRIACAMSLNALSPREKEEFKFWHLFPNIPWLDLMWWTRCKVGRLSRIDTSFFFDFCQNSYQDHCKVFGIPIKGFVILCKNGSHRDIMIDLIKRKLIFCSAEAKDFESYKYIEWFRVKVCGVII